MDRIGQNKKQRVGRDKPCSILGRTELDKIGQGREK